MPFRPQNGKNAIVEVVFGFHFARGWTSREISAVTAAHGAWGNELPRISPIEGASFQVGPGGITAQTSSLPAVMFERFKPDGSLSWRLSCRDDMFLVNCLEYDRWSIVFPAALSLLQRVAHAAGSTNMPISGLFLQYVDQFEWSGESRDYDLSTLLNLDGVHLPQSLTNRGKMWHEFQGWFDKIDAPSKIDVLNKIELSGQQVNGRTYQVRIDHLMRANLKVHQQFSEISDKGSWIDVIFDILHDLNKGTLRNYLNLGVSESLGL